jgi:ankyrin repeat protein
MSIEFQAQDHGTGETALHAAASNGHAEVLALLLQQPDAMTFLDRPDAVGWTALALAVMNKYPACVRTLLEAGANVDARCERHNAYTPLEEAIFNGDAVLVEMLLRAGANPDIPTWMGITARQRVHDPSYQHADVRALFKTG